MSQVCQAELASRVMFLGKNDRLWCDIPDVRAA